MRSASRQICVVAASILLEISVGSAEESPRWQAQSRWAGIFSGDGVALRAVSEGFIRKHLAGEPFSWESLRRASAEVCREGDTNTVEIRLDYHFVTSEPVRLGERKGAITRKWSGRSGLADWLYAPMYLHQGGVYAVSVWPTLAALSGRGRCEGFIEEGPVSYKIVPVDSRRDSLVLGVLGAEAGSRGPGSPPIFFTMTESGPRPFMPGDLTPTSPIWARTKWTILGMLLLVGGGYFSLAGYFHRLHVRLRDLPPYGSLWEGLTHNIAFFFSWRTPVYLAFGLTVHHIMGQALGFATMVLVGWSPRPSVEVSVDQVWLGLVWVPVSLAMPLYGGTVALTWALTYRLWARKWLPQGKTHLFFAGALVSSVYQAALTVGIPYVNRFELGIVAQYLIQELSDVGVVGVGLFWLYLRGLREGDLLVVRAERSTCEIERSSDAPISMVILAHMKDYLVGFDPSSRRISFVSSRDIKAIHPQAAGTTA